MERDYLRDLLDDQGKRRLDAVESLLTAMRNVSAPVKAERLGILGEENARPMWVFPVPHEPET
jgi:hypothetical protein